MATMLAWGGPAHGQMHQVPDDRTHWLVPIPDTARTSGETPPAAAFAIRTVTYTVDKVGWRDANGAPAAHSVLIGGDDHPERAKNHLIRLLNGLAALAAYGWQV